MSGYGYISEVRTHKPSVSIPREESGERLSEAENESDRLSSDVEIRPNFADLNDYDLRTHVVDRIRTAKSDTNAKADRFTTLWKGRYVDAGYPDRSAADQELLCRLAFWLDKEAEAMEIAMNQSCSERPYTDFGEPRKWVVRSGSYRSNSVAEAKSYVSNTYNPSVGGPTDFDKRPDVSYVTKNTVLDAISALGGIATANEIYEHPVTDRSKRQIRRALNEWIEQGVIEQIEIGFPCRTSYVRTPTTGDPWIYVSDDRLDELGVDPSEH